MLKKLDSNIYLHVGVIRGQHASYIITCIVVNMHMYALCVFFQRSTAFARTNMQLYVKYIIYMQLVLYTDKFLLLCVLQSHAFLMHSVLFLLIITCIHYRTNIIYYVYVLVLYINLHVLYMHIVDMSKRTHGIYSDKYILIYIKMHLCNALLKCT